MAMKRILSYLCGTPDFDLVVYAARLAPTWLPTPTSTGLAARSLIAPRRAMPCSSSAKRQAVASRSSVEAEYHVVANGVARATWLCQLLHELQAPSSRCTLVYCDNINAVYLSTNLVQHQRTKHVEIDLHFV
jgi:hypothetical protein